MHRPWPLICLVAGVGFEEDECLNIDKALSHDYNVDW